MTPVYSNGPAPSTRHPEKILRSLMRRDRDVLRRRAEGDDIERDRRARQLATLKANLAASPSSAPTEEDDDA